MRDLITKVPYEFTAKLAIYAREKMYLRSIPLVMAVELCKIRKRNFYLVRDLITRIIQRPDEIVEILSYYQEANKREGTKKLNKLSDPLCKGVAEAFHKFDEYQFAKYARDTEVKLRDALFLCHPKPMGKLQKALFKKIAEKTLEIPYTWEVELSKEDGRSKKEKWTSLISSGKLGYMAQLRNLRNMLEADPNNLNMVLANLSYEKNVLKSRQLPFRFFSAYREIAEVGEFKSSAIMECLESAIFFSTNNIKGFDENTNVLIACDMSASMTSTISEKSKIKNFEIGLVLGMLLQNKCKSVITGLFGDSWKIVQLPRVGILANTHKLANMIGVVGHSTNGYLAIRWLIDNKKVADKVFIFTDCQLWDSVDMFAYASFREREHSTLSEEWNKYKSIAPNSKLYIFDLAGYGQAPIDIKRNDVFMIAGWSEKIFEVLDSLEKGESNLAEIEKIEL
ncbi:hypothetical protein ES705_44871 [subsurface metagenome]